MTDYEVIHELNSLKSYAGNTNDVYRRDRAIEAAKSALEKQIPKTPEHDGEDEQDYFLCPRCKEPLCTIGDTVYFDMKPKYCEDCGQRIDWSDKE